MGRLHRERPPRSFSSMQEQKNIWECVLARSNLEYMIEKRRKNECPGTIMSIWPEHTDIQAVFLRNTLRGGKFVRVS